MKRKIKILSRGKSTVTITAVVNTNGAGLSQDESENIVDMLTNRLREALLGLPSCGDHALNRIRVMR